MEAQPAANGAAPAPSPTVNAPAPVVIPAPAPAPTPVASAAPAQAQTAGAAPAMNAAPAAAPASAVGGQLTTATEQPAPGAAPERPQGSWLASPLVWGVVLMWVILFIIRRKDNKKAQEAKEKLNNSLVRGARVVTIGRIHGEVVNVTDTTFTIKPDPKHDFTLTFEREAFMRLESDGQEAPRG